MESTGYWLFAYFIPINFFAALRVFDSSIAIVMGPTPPGTGDIYSTFGSTFKKSTSPIRVAPFLSKSSFLHSSNSLEAFSEVILLIPTSIIVEPSFEALALAEKINYMSDGIGVRTVKAILNKVPAEESRKKMIEVLLQRDISQIGTVSLDPQISKAGFEGKAPGESRAKGETKEITRRLLNGT